MFGNLNGTQTNPSPSEVKLRCIRVVLAYGSPLLTTPLHSHCQKHQRGTCPVAPEMFRQHWESPAHHQPWVTRGEGEGGCHLFLRAGEGDPPERCPVVHRSPNSLQLQLTLAEEKAGTLFPALHPLPLFTLRMIQNCPDTRFPTRQNYQSKPQPRFLL